MDEKKVREAIERIHKMRDAYNATLRSLPQKTRERSDYNNYVDAFLVAIEALEKQLPKKPDIMDYILGDVNFKCHTCKSEYICEKGYEHFYCPNCGQKIKWSE
jgi:cytochrome c556